MKQRILRPLDYGSLFDEMFDLYKNNFVLFAGIMGLAYIPMSVIIYVMLGSTVTGVDSDGPIFNWMPIAMLGLTGVLYMPVTYAAMAAITWAVSRCYLGEKPTILQSYGAILPGLLPFVLTVLLVTIMYLVGFVFCCVPGIAIMILTAFVAQVFVIEGKSYISAIKRSWELAASQWVRVMVVGIIAFLLSTLVQGIFTLPFQIISFLTPEQPFLTGSMAVLQGITEGAAQTVMMPVYIIAFVLLYYDARIRKEGFDVEMLVQGMERSPGIE